MTKTKSSIPVIRVPLNILNEDGITALPRVLETTAPENCMCRGIMRARPFAKRTEFFTMKGATALMPKQSAPAKGLS